MRIEIICTGDEILTGKTVNTNFSHISRKLQEAGLAARWGTTVGDDAQTLLEAFLQAGQRADAVIVNGGLGPTVDDLSQEIAAQAAGVSLVLHDEWLERIAALFRRYNMRMDPNNRKQALLPETALLIDNPIGTACGFELDIGRARFYFTPGVPKELHLMLEQQIMPRLLARSGAATVSRVKRFHSFGLGESHVDTLLADIADLTSQADVRLGFQTHYPQLEIKLSVRGPTLDELLRRLAPLEAAIRGRLGNFIVAEDDDTLEGVVIAALGDHGASVAVAETVTGGLVAARLAQVPDARAAFRRAVVAPAGSELEHILGLAPGTLSGTEITDEVLVRAARAFQAQSGATHALLIMGDYVNNAVPAASDPRLWFTIASAADAVVRRSQFRLISEDWLRLGAAEMSLDVLRRFLRGLPVDEKTDFERSL